MVTSTLELPAGIDARPLRVADAEAVAELRAAMELVDDTGEHEDADDTREGLEHPWFDPAKDSIGLWSGSRLIGWGAAFANPNAPEVIRVNAIGGVHPKWRRQGLGTRLLDWIDARARARHHELRPDLPGTLDLFAPDGNPGLRAMAEATGFAAVRYFFEMTVDLSSRPDPGGRVPAGLRLVAFDPAYSESTRLANNAAFRDHWGSAPRDPEAWASRLSSKTFRPGCSTLLLDGDEVASYLLAYEYDADTAVTGVRDLYIGSVGTLRPYRGRGAANAALARTLEAAAAAGFETASLGVDAENPTGALGLYERLGFGTERRFTTYSRPLA